MYCNQYTSMPLFHFQSVSATTVVQTQSVVLRLSPPVDVVLGVTWAEVTGANVADCLTWPTHMPTFPTLSTTVSSTLSAQQEAWYEATVMFSPPGPTTVVVLRVPDPLRMVTLSIPVPLIPSVKLATNIHWEESQSDEVEQLVDVLTSWHTGLLTSVTWRQTVKKL